MSNGVGRGKLGWWFGESQLTRRLVRQDGNGLEAAVSNLSTRGCDVDCELDAGELVSIEVTDLSLFIGEVMGTVAGRSTISFFGAVSH